MKITLTREDLKTALQEYLSKRLVEFGQFDAMEVHHSGQVTVRISGTPEPAPLFDLKNDVPEKPARRTKKKAEVSK